MAKINSVTWILEPHTKGKHLVLANYLNAWLPIISRYNKRILFIDGFSGPGKYVGGEDGSPLIAINTFKDHALLEHDGFEIIFYFIEEDRGRKEYLESVVSELKSQMRGKFAIHIRQGSFDETMTEALDDIDRQNKQLAPCFAMIDPFGVSDTPMSIIRRILQNDKSEVYVSFMYEWINRFKEHENFERHLDELYGCKEWRDGIDLTDPIERKNFFFSLYKSQLKRAGAKYVLHFELYEGNRLVYAIFFGTKNLVGCDKMKQSIWKIAPFGDFAFRGTHGDQLSLSLKSDDYSQLISDLLSKFRSSGWVNIQAVKQFVMSDETDFHSGQLKKNALQFLEDKNMLDVDESTRKRKRTYPDNVRMRFRS